MKNENIIKIAQELGVKESQISKVLDLTSQGNTIPFIARYRKEMTGNLDEVQIKSIIDLDKSMTALAERKATVLAKIQEQGKLTAELQKLLRQQKNWLTLRNFTFRIKKTSHKSNNCQRSRIISSSTFDFTK